MNDKITLTERVDEKMTAIELGSGDMPVLATPILVALMERAACELAAKRMESGQTTVGVYVQTTHEKASALGAQVRIEARLTEQQGRKLSFELVAYEGEAVIGRGRHDRVVVDRDRFLRGI